MEFFEKANAVRLKSHLNKYLTAGDDNVSVRQSRSTGSSPTARWLIERVETNDHVIRLKSCYGRYLTACSTPVLLGTTGCKVIQSEAENSIAIEWQPVRDGFQFKLKSSIGTYLRGNGAMPPWRNTVTHDGSFTSSMNNWILWDVEAVDADHDGGVNNCLSIVSLNSNASDEVSGDDQLRSPMSTRSLGFSPRTPTMSKKKVKMFRGSMTVTNTQFQFHTRITCNLAFHSFPCKLPHFGLNFHKKTQLGQESGSPIMDILHNAKVVRLKSHFGKYLHANSDQHSVSHDRNTTGPGSLWTVEFVSNTPDDISIIRLKSCYDKYLTSSNHPFLLGMTGKKVLQTVPSRLDSSVEWEPIGYGKLVKLKTIYGHYLRANGGFPPWKNSVTHDIPHRTVTRDWIMWEIEIVETNVPSLQLVPYSDSFTSSESSSPSTNRSKSPTFYNQESIDWPLKREEGRAIYYHVLSDDEEEIDKNAQGFCLIFNGNGVTELTQKLEEETRLRNITVCSESPLDGKLYPLQLQLPPNNVTMKVVVVQNSPKPKKQSRYKARSCSKSSFTGYF